MFSRLSSFKGSTKTPKTAWKRENLRVQLSSAPSVEECGLDSTLYGEGLHVLTPRESTRPKSPFRETASIPSPSKRPLNATSSMPGLANDTHRRETFIDEAEILSFSRRKENIRNYQPINFESNSSIPPSQVDSGDVRRKTPNAHHVGRGMTGNLGHSFTPTEGTCERVDTDAPVVVNHTRFKEQPSLRLRSSAFRHSSSSSSSPTGHYDHSKSSSRSNNNSNANKVSGGIELDEDGRPLIIPAIQEQYGANVAREACDEGPVNYSPAGKSMAEVHSQLKSNGISSEIEEVPEEEPSSSSFPAVGGAGRGVTGRPTSPISIPNNFQRSGKDLSSSPPATSNNSEGGCEKEVSPSKSFAKPPLVPSPRLPRVDSALSASQAGASSSTEARRRWRRVSHTLTFARHMSNVRASASDFLEHTGPDAHVRSDAGRAGAAAFEGARTRALGGRARAKGRKGMEGMLVRQDKGLVTLVQDFYVACLKMPIAHFLVGVFLAPIALGLLFTPLYLFDKAGLALDGIALSDPLAVVGKMAAAKQKVSALLNVFLYALSLSTTFGGSPVNAVSPFCLVVANINTLMGQFLFVFLSGAVFARMSQPSHPVRCSKKAIIRIDDFTPPPLDDVKERNRVFAVRLVLTGPPPCELVDAKICLTFRIFIKLPSGSMFCSTQDLELVRPEVPYLRYGIMVRHIIDKRSPLYGLTMETLSDGDASFSLTISGQERTSMQPIFHLEDYFVCDGDVAWDGEYVDFIHINNESQRVLDHSKIDEIHISPETKFGFGGTPSTPTSLKSPEKENAGSAGPVKGWSANALRGRKIWSSKSTSFTRADW